MEATNSSNLESVSKTQLIYRCKKCRRILASEENIVSHERGKGQQSFKWRKRNGGMLEEEPSECSSIFVEPMKWMETVQESCVEEKLQCMGCKARLGSFNWAGMQCNCGAWVNPAFQLHKSRLDECRISSNQDTTTQVNGVECVNIEKKASEIHAAVTRCKELLKDVVKNAKALNPTSRHTYCRSKMTITEMIVNMDCVGCETKVRKDLQKLEGVDEVDIDIEQQKVTVMGWAEQEDVLKTVRKTDRRAELWHGPSNPEEDDNSQLYYYDYEKLSENVVEPIMTYYIPPSSYDYGYDSEDYDEYYRHPAVTHSTHIADRATAVFSDENPHACSIM